MKLNNIKEQSGVVKNFLTEVELDAAIDVFKKFNSVPVPNGTSHGITPNHVGYAWFNKFIMKKLHEQFGPDFKLKFAMYQDLTQPFGVHSDLYHVIPNNPFISCLIPCSVDYNPDLTNLATTDLFEEIDTDATTIPTNPTPRARVTWHRGDLIWWDTCLFHSGGEFTKFSSKQSIVMHTYV